MRLMDGPTAGQQGDPGLCRELHLSHLSAAAGFFFFFLERTQQEKPRGSVPGESSCRANATKPLPSLPVDFSFGATARMRFQNPPTHLHPPFFLFFVGPQRKLQDWNTCSHAPSSAKAKLRTTKLFVQSSSGVVDGFRLKVGRVGGGEITQRLYSSLSSPVGASILFHPSIHFPSFCWKPSEAEREDVGCTIGEPRPEGLAGVEGEWGHRLFFCFCVALFAIYRHGEGAALPSLRR